MRWKFVSWITLSSTKMSGILIRKRKQQYTLDAFRKMQKGSLGWEYYQSLTLANLQFQPNLVRHDLKHILLGYSMEIRDELKIQAFLIGNKSYNSLAIMHLTLYLVVVPEIIPTLKAAYLRGKQSLPLRCVDLNVWVQKDLTHCRKMLGISSIKP